MSSGRLIRAWSVVGFLSVLAGGMAPASAAVILDDFSDGGALLHSTPGNVVGSESASAALGGWRAFFFHNSYNAGTLALDQSDGGQLRLTSTGLGQVVLGYGQRLGSSAGNSLVGTTTSALNADLRGYSGLRFQVVENPLAKLKLSVTLFDTAGHYSHVENLAVGSVSNGAFDLPFASIPATSGGGANLADVDFISIVVSNGWVGHTVSLDRIELIPVPEPAAAALLGLGGMALLARRQR